LNLSYFISKRINKTTKNSFSSTIHSIAVASIGIGLAVMIVSFLILGGFETTIKDKIFSFSGHFQVTKFSVGNSYEENPITTDTELFKNYHKYDFLKHVQAFSHKPGLLKTEEEVLGVVLKGVGHRFDTVRFQANMEEGRFISFSDTTDYSTEIVISRHIANTLMLGVGDDILMYFVQNPPRFRKLTVSGIYATGLEDFDEKIIIGDIALIQRLNGWDEDMVGGYEVFVKYPGRVDDNEEEIVNLLDFNLDVESVQEKYIQIFDWLTLLNRNVYIFLTLILFVACFNMVAILLILIMERTQMIGLLKALGATNRQIRNIFLNNGILLILKGLLWGNLIGIGFGFVQSTFKIISLDPENYYMDKVPIEWNWGIILLLNALIFLAVSLTLIIPTAIVSRIHPVKAIRFD
jgi:lipoprotein-releasing system permease protein